MKKALTFLPGHRSDKQDSESGGTSSTLFRRREQLRKAQRTHRLRKDQYFKNLESEVLRLRKNEVNLAIQVRRLRDQVDMLQAIVDKHELLAFSEPLQGVAESGNTRADLTPAKTPTQDCEHDENIRNGSSFCGDRVGRDLEVIDLPENLPNQLIYRHDMEDHRMNSHDQVNDSLNPQQPIQDLCPPTVNSRSTLQNPQSRFAGQVSTQQMTDMGMEFVLALEQPCLNHLEHHSDRPNGHALLASATLVHPHTHQCAPSTFSHNASSQQPAFVFDKLLALSQELVLDDELSPTQAWYHIVQQSWAKRLDLLLLRELSAALLKLIKCYGFGAVMRRDAFEAILVQTCPVA